MEIREYLRENKMWMDAYSSWIKRRGPLLIGEFSLAEELGFVHIDLGSPLYYRYVRVYQEQK